NLGRRMRRPLRDRDVDHVQLALSAVLCDRSVLATGDAETWHDTRRIDLKKIALTIRLPDRIVDLELASLFITKSDPSRDIARCRVARVPKGLVEHRNPGSPRLLDLWNDRAHIKTGSEID